MHYRLYLCQKYIQFFTSMQLLAFLSILYQESKLALSSVLMKFLIDPILLTSGPKLFQSLTVLTANVGPQSDILLQWGQIKLSLEYLVTLDWTSEFVFSVIHLSNLECYHLSFYTRFHSDLHKLQCRRESIVVHWTLLLF